MFLSGLFGWTEGCPKPSPRTTTELVTETLMLELSIHLKRSEKLHRERAIEYRRVKSGVDYSWLISPPRQGFELAPGEMLELQELCSQIKPTHCGPALLRFRKLVTEYEPEVQEVPRIFRSVLQDFTAQAEEEEERLLMQANWEKNRTKSLSFLTFKSRIRINPFKNENQGQLETGLIAARRVRSMPEFSTTEEV
ncbi:protein RD3-like [Latimeria chalumnae]|uniref:Zgc:162144 n=1 Tax=Latimeria chalumnae TaxID=7897 RepID=H2ZZ64_LATCH|nr:PREDICTED: protein RD3-like [Latimeria chalumnae]|eukprot:XP_014354249.1 PREDICTED: protein RD3-like [Latimeria chalumnae]